MVSTFKALPDPKRRHWPPVTSEVRLRLRANRAVEIEARCWKKGTEDAELEKLLYAPEWFAHAPQTPRRLLRRP